MFMGMNPYMNPMNPGGMQNPMMMNQWNPYQPYNPYTQYNPWMYGAPNYNQTFFKIYLIYFLKIFFQIMKKK